MVGVVAAVGPASHSTAGRLDTDSWLLRAVTHSPAGLALTGKCWWANSSLGLRTFRFLGPPSSDPGTVDGLTNGAACWAAWVGELEAVFACKTSLEASPGLDASSSPGLDTFGEG